MEKADRIKAQRQPQQDHIHTRIIAENDPARFRRTNLSLLNPRLGGNLRPKRHTSRVRISHDAEFKREDVLRDVPFSRMECPPTPTSGPPLLLGVSITGFAMHCLE